MASQSTPPTDRRRHERFELLAQVHINRAAEDFVLELANISESGALLLFGSLRKPVWIDIDRVVDLAIVHPVTLESLALRGRVVRLQRDERGLTFAVQFEAMDEPTRASVQELTRIGRILPPPLPPTGKP